jgi:pimeloyl-ACP methyl ester carboxylesterase
MSLMQSIGKGALLAFLSAGYVLLTAPAAAQDPVGLSFESRYVDVGGRLHYGLFGGDGLPIVFISYAGQGGCSAGLRCGPSFWGDFPRGFIDSNHVLALAPRGVGQSEASNVSVSLHGEDIVGFLDAIGIQRAVLVGTRGSLPLTYVAEHYPERVAGLVFLSPGRQLERFVDADTTRSVEMMMRIEGEFTLKYSRALAAYRPYARADGSTIDVPTLTFVTASGTAGLENLPITPLEISEYAAQAGVDFISDVVAREYFTRLSLDSQLQAQVRSIWEDLIVPGMLEEERAFMRAFGDNLQVVRLHIPLVTGKEFESSPDLLHPHIRRFLNAIRAQ